MARRDKKESTVAVLKDEEFVKHLQDRFEGFELVEYLQIPIEAVLIACEEYDWINEENIEDLQEFVDYGSDIEEDD